MSLFEDQQRIRDLQSRYADICSRQKFDELPTLILPDASISLDLRGRSLDFTGPKEIGDFIAASIEPFDFFQFLIRNSVVDVEESGEAATGRLWMSELRHVRETGQWSTIFGLYHDQYVNVNGEWMIAARQYHSLARISHALDDCVVFDFPEGFHDLKTIGDASG